VTIEADGRCSVCHGNRFAEEMKTHLTSDLAELQRLAAGWRAARQGRYDCVIGGSGGLDSSYVLYVAKRLLGLNPLVVHYDHGFFHEAAVANLRALCSALEVDLQEVRSRGRHDRHSVRHMALAFRPTGLYWAVCAFCGTAIQAVIFRTALRERAPLVLGSLNLFEDRLHMKRAAKVALLRRALQRLPAWRWPAFAWHLALAAWHLFRLRLEFHVPPLANLFARRPLRPDIRWVTVSRYVPWDVPAMVAALEPLGWRAPLPALPMRFDCMIEDGLVNQTWQRAGGLTVQGVIACNLVHGGVCTRAELAEAVAHVETAIPAATAEVERRLGIR
jgi:hypothetical protein